MRVGIVAQRDNPRAASLASDIREYLVGEGFETAVDETTAARIDETDAGVSVEEMGGCDLVVSIGGDGTFLYAARGAGTTPVMGINLGEVGFLNAVPPEEAVEAVAAVVGEGHDGELPHTRSMSRVEASGDGWRVPPAINEIAVLGPRGHGGGIDLKVRIDGAEYTSGHADGVLVATPTGSTAYNLSEDGPLVHPDVPGLVVTEMAGADEMAPLVVDADSDIEVRVGAAPRAVVVSDGRVREEIDPPESVSIGRAGEPVRIAGPPLDFFAGLGKLD